MLHFHNNMISKTQNYISAFKPTKFLNTTGTPKA